MEALVAEDEAVSRLLLTSTLERLGFVPRVVTNGQAAWDALSRADGPRLALLDWNMPSPNGPELCRRLRARQGAPYVYIILVTAKSRTEDAVAGLDAGADDFIRKPFDPDELRARLRSGQRIIDLESKLQRSQYYLAAVLANIDDGILLSDDQDKVIFANAAMSYLVGIDTAVVGTIRGDLLTHYKRRLSDPTAADAIAAAHMQDDSVPPIDVKIESPKARVHRWNVRAVALPDAAGQLDIVRDVTSEAELAQVLTERALLDFLTGVPNRRAGEEAASRDVNRSERTGAPLSFIIIDVDHFKRVNDTHGHPIGDRVLQQVAIILQASTRQTDVVARWGGEEFLLVLANTSLEHAYMLAERVRANVAAFRSAGLPEVTISAGVGLYEVGERTSQHAIARADANLYAAKQAGRNCVR